MKAEEIRERAEKAEGQLKSVKIPEWKCEIYYRPLTVSDQQYVMQKFKGMIDDQLALSLESVFLKALDSEGNRIWTTEEHREFLRTKVSDKIITRLILAINGANIEEAKKNLKKAQY